MSADIHDIIGTAATSESGVYPEPGVYPILRIDVAKVIESRKGDKLFCAEMEILDSQVAERPAGTTMSWMANLTKHDAAAGNVRKFLASAAGITVEQVDPEGSRAAVSPQNPLHGRLVRLEAVATKTRAGGDFTLCKFSALPEELQARSTELRDAAGFSGSVAPF